MKNKYLVLILTAIFLAASQPVQAETVWEKADSVDYGTKVQGMLGRGFTNIVTSPVDIFVHTVEATQTQPPLVGTLSGLGSGVGCTTLRALSGVIDVVFFWVPDFNGFKISQSYSNCFEADAYGPAGAAAYSDHVVEYTPDQVVSEPAPQPVNWENQETAVVVSKPAPAQPVKVAEAVKESVPMEDNRMQYVDKSGTASKVKPEDRMKYIK